MLVLATLTGEMLVSEACDELDLGATQFAHLRRRALQGAADALAAQASGRPRRAIDVTPEELDALRQRVEELERERVLLAARLELAMLPLLQQRPKSRRRRAPDARPAAEA